MAENLDCIMSCMVITNPLQTGHPVVFATKGFAEMVGYHREALLGKSVFQVREMFQTLSTSTLLYLHLWYLNQHCSAAICIQITDMHLVIVWLSLEEGSFTYRCSLLLV